MTIMKDYGVRSCIKTDIIQTIFEWGHHAYWLKWKSFLQVFERGHCAY
jgi:hypothetical protein